MQQKRLLISFEGIEGSGKTTQIQRLAGNLTRMGYDIVCSREPGGCLFSDRIRALFLANDIGTLQSETELCLLGASRIEHIKNTILPALQSNKIVLVDRFIDASVAYQGYGREVGAQKVKDFHQLLNITLQPDLTILLDCDPHVSAERIAKRGEKDRIEKEKEDFFTKIREGYLIESQNHPERFRVFQANRDIAELESLILTEVLRVLS